MRSETEAICTVIKKIKKSIITDEFIQNITYKIVQEIHPDKIILFGSHSYGKPAVDSDIDLLIIKEGVKAKRSEAVKVRKILRGFKKSFDIIVTTPIEFEFYSKEWVNSVFAEAKKKGIVVYERV